MIYNDDNANFSDLRTALASFSLNDNVINNALAWLNTDNDRDPKLLDGIAPFPAYKHENYQQFADLAGVTKREILKKGDDELIDRYLILIYKVLGLWSVKLEQLLNDVNLKRINERREIAFRSFFGDDTPAIFYALDFKKNSEFFFRDFDAKNADNPTMIRAAELIAADYPYDSARICAIVLDKLPAPEKKKGISGLLGKKNVPSEAMRAVELLKQIIDSGISPKNSVVLTALTEASLFSEDMNSLFDQCMKDNNSYCLSVFEQLPQLNLDFKRCDDALFNSAVSVDDKFILAFGYKLSRNPSLNYYTYFAELLADKYTDVYSGVMREITDMDVLFSMAQALRKVRPDAADPVNDAMTGARNTVAEAVSSRFKEKDKVRDYLLGNISFAEVYAAVDNDSVSGYAFGDRHNYYRLYGLDDFLSRCLTVMTLCVSGYNNFIWNDTGFDLHNNFKDYIKAMLGTEMDGRQLLRAFGNSIDTMYDKEKQTHNIVALLSERAADIAAADTSGLVVMSRLIQIKVMASQHNRFKTDLIAAAEDSSKVIRSAVVDILAEKNDWQEDIIAMLSSKKAAVREVAVSVIEKQGADNYTRALESALNCEKSAKIKTRISVLLGAPVEDAPENSGSGDVVKDLTKGNKTKKLAWLFTQPFQPVRTSDGGEAPELTLQALLLCYANIPGQKDPAADTIAAGLNSADTENFALDVLGRWIDEGAVAKNKWVLFFSAVHGGSEAISTLVQYIKEWSENSRGAIASDAVRAIALNGSSSALMIVDEMSRKYKKRQVRSAAGEAMNDAAQLLGITKEELADRIVPDLGFDEKMCRTFNYGSRQFSVYLTPSLDIEIFNGDKKIKNLPKPGANDDPELSAKAYNDFKEMKKLMKSTVSAQRSRLEYVLMCDRKWSADNWKKLFVSNPLMHCFAVGLIWGIYDENGLSASFRYLDDGSFTTSDEDEFEIPDNASIGLVHPIELSADELAVWKEQLSDYEITQPFPQLDRCVFHITDEEKSMTDITRFNDRELNGLAFAGKMLKFGWFKGTAEDAGMFYYFYRTDSPKSGESYTAELKFSGMYIEVFYDNSDDVSVETLSFYTNSNDKPVPAGEVSPRYFSEIIKQLTEAIGAEE